MSTNSSVQTSLILIFKLDGYHIYHDHTGFQYDITLARANLTTNKNQRYSLKVNSNPNPHPDPGLNTSTTPFYFSTPIFPSFTPRSFGAPIRNPFAQRLQLYETHATPRLYACYSKYSAPDQRATVEMLAPVGSSFELAFDHFQKFFTLKTLKEWDQRLVKANMGDEAFVYAPPKEGEPQGLLLPVAEGMNGVYNANRTDQLNGGNGDSSAVESGA